MPSVLFWAGVGGGTAHYRCRIPGAALARLGWDVHHVSDLDIPPAADVVVLQRVLHPGTVDIIRGLQAAGSKVVYDIDDWYDGVPAYNPASKGFGPDALDMLHAALAAADLITTSTPELAEAYSRLGEARVLGNYLDRDLWFDAAKYRLDRSHVHVGWLGSAMWRTGDVELLRPWLADWLATKPDVKFVVAGSDRSLFEYLGCGGLICPPSKQHVRPFQHLPAMLGWFDIGLAPLVRNKFNDAKSWVKGLEYNAAGAPVVASPSREYRTFVRPGINGYLVSKKNWVDALELALDDLEDLRAGALKVAGEYWIDDHVDKWVTAYAR